MCNKSFLASVIQAPIIQQYSKKHKNGNTTTVTKKGAQVLWKPETCLAVSANTSFMSFYHQEQQEQQSWLQSGKLCDTLVSQWYGSAV